MVRRVVLHAVPYIRKSLRLGNTQGSLNGTVKHGGGSVMVWSAISIMVQYSVGPIITLHGRITEREHVDRLGDQVLQSRDLDLISEQRCSFPRRQCPHHTAGLKSVRVNFTIFPGQRNHQIWTSLSQFWSWSEEQIPHLQHL
jgi:hypothetical protein